MTKPKDDKPHADVRRIGRWRYSIRIIDGIRGTGSYHGGEPWTVWGYRHAVHKARKELKKYLRRKLLRDYKERIDP